MHTNNQVKGLFRVHRVIRKHSRDIPRDHQLCTGNSQWCAQATSLTSTRSGENADATGAYEEADDDEHQSPQVLATSERHDARDHEDHGQEPEYERHD